MFDFFEQVLGYIESAFDFFTTFCENLFNALGLLYSSINLPYFLSGYLPGVLGSCVAIVTALSVIKFLIGR